MAQEGGLPACAKPLRGATRLQPPPAECVRAFEDAETTTFHLLGGGRLDDAPAEGVLQSHI